MATNASPGADSTGRPAGDESRAALKVPIRATLRGAFISPDKGTGEAKGPPRASKTLRVRRGYWPFLSRALRKNWRWLAPTVSWL